MPPRRQPDERQLRLDWTSDLRERFALLDAIGYQRTGLSRHRWARVVALLKAIHLRGWRDGCHAFVGTLAEAMGVSRRTLYRVRDDAIDRGLLTIEARYNQRGRVSNHWRIEWQQIACLGIHERPATAPPAVDNSVDNSPRPPAFLALTGGNLALTGGNLTLTHLKESVRLSVQHPNKCLVDRDDDDQKHFEEKFSAWRLRRQRLLRELGPPRCAADVSLADKAAMLSLQLGENWLWDAVEGSKRLARNPYAYLHRSLANASGATPGAFNAMLKSVRLPESYRATPLEESDNGMRARQCEAAERDDLPPATW